MPLRINIGAKGLDNGEVELIPRRTKQMTEGESAGSGPGNSRLDRKRAAVGAEVENHA